MIRTNVAGVVAAATISLCAMAAPTEVVRGEREFEITEAIGTSPQNAWVVIASRRKGNFGGPEQTLELRKLDSKGTLRTAPALQPALAEAQTGETVFALAGEAVVAAAAKRNVVTLTRIDAARGNAARNTIQTPGRNAHVSAIVPIQGADLLLLGRGGRYAWIARVGNDLQAQWTKSIQEFPAAFTSDAVVLPDGSFVACGGAIVDGRKSVWAATFDANGAVKEQIATAGTDARIAIDPAGGYVLLHDAEEGGTYDVWLRGLSPTLAVRWSRRLSTGSKMNPSMELAKNAGDVWVAAFESEARVSIAAGRGNDVTWTHTPSALSKTWEALWSIARPIVSGSTVILPYTVVTVDERGEQRQVGRVDTLSMR